MASPAISKWMRLTTQTLAQRARFQAEGAIPSSTLRRAQTIKRFSVSKLSLHIPHYWAVYVHDGRGPIRMPPGRLMVWYKDPADDPRLKAGYPVRATQVKHLTKRQFIDGIRKGKLIVARAVGPRRGAKFYDNEGNMAPFLRNARGYIRRRMTDLVREQMKGLGVPQTLVL